jgi:hypothetical protein
VARENGVPPRADGNIRLFMQKCIQTSLISAFIVQIGRKVIYNPIYFAAQRRELWCAPQLEMVRTKTSDGAHQTQ